MTMTDRVFAAVLAVFVAGTLGLGQAVDHYEWPVVRMPLAVGTLAVVLLLWVVLRPRGAALAEPEEEMATLEAPRGSLRRDVRGMVQVFLLLPVLWILGFLVGLPVYVLFTVRYHGHGWAMAGGLALLALAIAYVLFWQVLSVPLPMKPLILR